MDEEAQTAWVETYLRFRRRIRVLSGAILLLAFVGFFDGLANNDRLAEEYHLAVDLILEEQQQPTMSGQIKSIHFTKSMERALREEKLSELIEISIKDIPQLHRKYVRGLAAKNEKVAYKIANQSIGMDAYILTLIFGPFILLLAMSWPMTSIRQLHRRLASLVTPDGSVQQKLNSLFFDRVTTFYGEGWRLHASVSLVVIFSLAVSTPILFAATQGMVSPDLSLAINAEGMVFPLDNDPLHSKTVFDKNSPVVPVILIACFLTLIAIIILFRIALTTIYRSEEDSN
jgi:hypothetical protein